MQWTNLSWRWHVKGPQKPSNKHQRIRTCGNAKCHKRAPAQEAQNLNQPLVEAPAFGSWLPSSRPADTSTGAEGGILAVKAAIQLLRRQIPNEIISMFLIRSDGIGQVPG